MMETRPPAIRHLDRSELRLRHPQELGPAARPEDGIGYPGRVQENRAAETLRPCWRGLDEY
jgi:hypothetical protein